MVEQSLKTLLNIWTAPKCTSSVSKYLHFDFVSRVLVCLRFSRNKFAMDFVEIKKEMLDRESIIKHDTFDGFILVLPHHEELMSEAEYCEDLLEEVEELKFPQTKTSLKTKLLAEDETMMEVIKT